MSEALRLAERCESLASIADAYSEEAYRDAAAELRRLHAENDRLREALVIAREYAAAHLLRLQEAYAGHPSRYEAEALDLAAIDAALK